MTEPGAETDGRAPSPTHLVESTPGQRAGYRAWAALVSWLLGGAFAGLGWVEPLKAGESGLIDFGFRAIFTVIAVTIGSFVSAILAASALRNARGRALIVARVVLALALSTAAVGVILLARG